MAAEKEQAGYGFDAVSMARGLGMELPPDVEATFQQIEDNIDKYYINLGQIQFEPALVAKAKKFWKDKIGAT